MESRNHQSRNSYHYNYYDNFLFSPGGTPGIYSLTGGPRKSIYDELPDALKSHANDFRTRDDVYGGVGYVILERPGTDCYWLDPKLDYRLCRRERFDPRTGRLKELTIFSDFKPVGGVHLPTFVVLSEFDGSSAEQGPTATKTLRRVEFSLDPLPNSAFQITAPSEDVMVHDVVNGRFFKRYPRGDHPILSSAEAARGKYRGRSHFSWAASLMILAALGAAVAAWGVLRRRTLRTSPH